MGATSSPSSILKNSSLLQKKNMSGRSFLSRRRRVQRDEAPLDDDNSSTRSMTSVQSFASLSSNNENEDPVYKMIGSGHIGAGFLETVAVTAYSSNGLPRLDEKLPSESCVCTDDAAGILFDEHVSKSSMIISLTFERNVGLYSMVTYLDHGLRRHLRLVRKRADRTMPEDNDDIYDEYIIRQCQQLVTNGLLEKNTATKGTVMDILFEEGRVALSVNGKKAETLYDCPELAAAGINMFLSTHSPCPSLRRSCIKRCKLQRQQAQQRRQRTSSSTLESLSSFSC